MYLDLCCSWRMSTCQKRWTNALVVLLRQYEHPLHLSSARLGGWGTVAVVYLFLKWAHSARGAWIPGVVTGSSPWLCLTEIFSCAPATSSKSRSQLQLRSRHGCLPHKRRMSMRQNTITSAIRFSLTSCEFIDSEAHWERNGIKNLTCENKWLLLKEFMKQSEIIRC